MVLDGVEIPVLVVGVVQVIKQLFPKLGDKGKLIVALVVGVILLGLAQAAPYFAVDTQEIVMAVVRVLGYAIAIPGWFSVVKDDMLGNSS